MRVFKTATSSLMSSSHKSRGKGPRSSEQQGWRAGAETEPPSKTWSSSRRRRPPPPAAVADKKQGGASIAESAGAESRLVNSNLSLPWLPKHLSGESQKILDQLLATDSPQIRSIATTAWVPMVDVSEAGKKPTPAGSLFGGCKILIKSGSDLPVCLNCKISLSFVCQIERESLLHPFQGKGLVQVFACAKCSSNKSLKSRATCWASVINPQDPVELRDLVSPSSVSSNKRVVKWLPRKDYMHPSQAEETLFCRLSVSQWAALGEAQIRGDKIGGFPAWLKSDTSHHEKSKLKCKVCDSALRLLLTVDSCDHAPFEWGSDGCLLVFECPAHPEQVSALIMST